MTQIWHESPNRRELARELAGFVTDRIAQTLLTRDRAGLVVSGGRTPVQFFDELASRTLPWSRVVITLADERWVDETSDRSNARLVREHLLQGAATAACFVPLHVADVPHTAAREAVRSRVEQVPRPFSVVVLGVGEDGHTASFFPRATELAACLDGDTPSTVVPVVQPGTGEPRMTLTLPVLLDADALVLHFEGETKRDVVERALRPGPESELPARAVLTRAKCPVHLFWSP
ncbi:MAG: 6-phosphogluconolactonase [Betaproteobacteria bacterium]|nr:6-phosphogluconolactonase [Betaproteobacteria bacterium]